MNTPTSFWRKCSTCKKEIPTRTKYYECSVSTCTGQRTGYVFCSVNCWEVHLPGARHRDAGAVEKTSPSVIVQNSEATEISSGPVRRIIPSSATTAKPNINMATSPMKNEVLVVVSKMKQYIRDISEMNTSEEVNQILSDMIREECEKAITQARSDGRKTVMARDFKQNK